MQAIINGGKIMTEEIEKKRCPYCFKDFKNLDTHKCKWNKKKYFDALRPLTPIKIIMTKLVDALWDQDMRKIRPLIQQIVKLVEEEDKKALEGINNDK